MSRLARVDDVVAWRLCIGCGACVFGCPERKVSLVDFLSEGIRPVVDAGACTGCDRCLDVCPGVATDFGGTAPEHAGRTGLLGDDAFRADWGPVLEVWEGHAADPDVRFRGSSGGALTALAMFCLERGGLHGVLHTGQDPADPLRNRTRLSRDRAGLLAAVGSRYSPAAVCDGLQLVADAPAPCVVIGKPGEIAAVTKARLARPELDAKVGLTLSFFCAESPSTKGTTELLGQLGVQPADVADLRYRGQGWPGHFAPTRRGESEPAGRLTYQESWAFLQRFRPWSVHLWPDGGGELADISCGDPWYEQPDGQNPGSSLVVVRTERGREVVRQAIAAGYLDLRRAEPWKLDRSQRNLAGKKAAVWGRQVAMRAVLAPVTAYRHARLWDCWRRLPWGEKMRSTFGTVRRALQRGLFRRLVLDRHGSVPVRPPLVP